MKPKNSLTLKIESLSYSGGRGVGRSDGMVIFVPNTAPGDIVKVRITNQKPRFAEAEVVEVVEASSSRRTPPCPVANRCGGCSWQHVEYAEQLRQKDKILRDSLRKMERLRPFEWREIIPAPQEFHYRNRIQLQIRDGNYGFFAKGTRDLVQVQKCWIAEQKINDRIKELTSTEVSHSKLELAVRPDGSVVLMPDKRDPEEALFSQVNTAQNEALIRAVLELVKLVKLVNGQPEWIFDLYCGSGNITVPIHNQFPDTSVVAIDLSRASIERAPKLPRVEFIAGDVGKVLGRMKPSIGAGVAVLDPPRTGLDQEVVRQLFRHRPQQIVYVSCNPATFARDAERLTENSGYILESVQGLDMFPQTEHVELVASLCAAT